MGDDINVALRLNPGGHGDVMTRPAMIIPCQVTDQAFIS